MKEISNNREKLFKKLSVIQSELKAPKGQFNSFGKYKYRSCEDILEGLKPLLSKQGVVLLLSDKLSTVLDRVYVEATVVLSDGIEEISCSAYAREELTKKGMDSSQITGTASSYARKYALNGMFCIDDTKDSDATNGVVATYSKPTTASKATKVSPSTTTAPEASVLDKAIGYLKKAQDKQKAYDLVMSKVGNEMTPAQVNALKKFVR